MNKVTFLLLSLFSFNIALFAQTPDTTFMQPVSVKYSLSGKLKGSTTKKVVIDHNDRVYVLTDKGLGRVFGDQVVPDRLYRPLADKRPVDITTQEGTGKLYYLFDHYFLSNTNAGKPFGTLPPGKFTQMTVSGNSEIMLAGKAQIAIYKNKKLHSITAPDNSVIDIQSFKNIFYVLYADGIYRLAGDRLQLISKGKGLKTFAFRKNEILLGTAHGYYGINFSTGDTTLSLQTRIPIWDIEDLMVSNGKLWAATGRGAFMKKHNTSGFRYYASRRWLNEDSVISMATDSKGNIYALTPTGLNEIKFVPMTFLQKAKYFQNKIRRRHIRYGLLSQVILKSPGDLSTAEMADTDNDGLWTSFYLGSQAFRYAVTKNPKARQYCWESFAAYERLLTITSLNGFPARTFERTGYNASDRSGKKWRPSPDSGWTWKGTTSSDEFVGYIFVAALMDKFVAETPEEKKRVADFIDKILSHIIKNNYYFVDVNGKPTLWGRWNPEYINWYAKTISDRKLGSTDLVAGLQLGYALTGKAIYKKEALRLMNEKGYLENIMISPYNIKATPGYIYKNHDMGMGPWNHSDDEMEFLSYWVLYHYALNKELQQKFGKAIKAYWQIENPEKNPVWNLITLGTEGSFDKASTLWYMREFPMDLIRWNMKNSIRKDLTFLPENFRSQYTKEVLSPAERPAHRYNSNEFRLDGGENGMSELTGAEYLSPYWMARYLDVLAAPKRLDNSR